MKQQLNQNYHSCPPKEESERVALRSLMLYELCCTKVTRRQLTMWSLTSTMEVMTSGGAAET
ncbi:hypothetical protein AG1IA_02232 [Rhizoctonia solani AG-1 IA]|uniref:Uncharacterized protein n=1 Tax=Thanatephorus cucumeris (strain AG1-IA) TaxID=983506 RepID=L8X3P7_THACA|nr:hypothetical protein AG1IA_02232 [Rhizoctonia solani AG-1 IA]